MIQISMSSYMDIEVERRLDEIRDQVAQSQLAHQTNIDETKKDRPEHILARIGKRLATIGSNMEARYGKRPSECCDPQRYEYC